MLKKIIIFSSILLILGSAVFVLINYHQAKANGFPPLPITIVQPINAGQTKMASPLIVTTPVSATCYYNVDSDFILALPMPPKVMRTYDSRIHVANMTGLEPGTHTVYVHCYESDCCAYSEGVASSTWTKLSPGTTQLLGVDGAGQSPGVLYEIDSETGAKKREIGAVGDYYITGLAQDPGSGILYATTGIGYPGEVDTSKSLLTINPSTGAGTLVGKVREAGVGATFFMAGALEYIDHHLADIAFDSSGQLYGWSEQNDDLYRVDKTTGAATSVGESGLSTWGDGISFNSSNQLYLLPDGHSPAGSLALINTSTGVPEDGYPMATKFVENFCAFGAAAFDATDMFFAQANNCTEGGATWGSLMVIDINTGIIVDLGESDAVRMAVVDGIGVEMALMDAIAFYSYPPVSYGVREQDLIPPGSLTNINITADNTGLVTITWADPTDPDLSQIVIDENWQQTGTTHYIDKGIQTLILNGRQTGQEYTYTFRAIDINGNLSIKQIYTITIPIQGTEQIPPPVVLILEDPVPADPLPPNIEIGSLVKLADSNAIYFIDQDNRLHAFSDLNTYNSWFSNFDNVQIISAEVFAAIPLGSNVTIRPGTHLIKIQTDPKVYVIEPYGVIRWLTSEQIALDLYGLDWNNKIVDVNPVFFADYQAGSDVSASVHSLGSVIQYAGSSDIYYIENGLKRLIAPDVFSKNYFQDRFILKNIPESISYALGADFPELPIATLMTLR